MYLKQSLLLLLVAVCVPSIVAGTKQHDNFSAKQAVRKRVLCSAKYTANSKKCTAKYNNVIKKCGDEADAAELKLEETSVKNSEKLLLDTGGSCHEFGECGSGDADVSRSFACLSQKCSNSAILMKRIAYNAAVSQLSYNTEKKAIDDKMSSCTNAATEQLSVETNAILDALTKCVRSGIWELPSVSETMTADDFRATEEIAEHAETSQATEKELQNLM